jgi:hypothetical protein
MYLLEKRERHKIFKNHWLPWQAKQVFDDKNSQNPKKEALQAFENIKRNDDELWRVTHNNCFLIEHR